MESKKVSVIIPCYQQDHFLGRALRSLEAQSYSNIEAVIIDDGSSPPVTVDHNEYSFPIILHRQQNAGLAAARNAGIRLATGDYIKFLDADDELLPHCLEEQVQCCAHDKNAVNVIGWTNHCEETGAQHDIIPAFADPIDALLMINIGPVHSYLFSTNEIKNTHRFDESLRKGCEDYDFIFRVALAGATFSTLHRVGVIYYRRSDSMSAAKDKMIKSRAEVWARHALELLRTAPSNRQHTTTLLAAFAYMLDITGDRYRQPLLDVHAQLMRHCEVLCRAIAPDQLEFVAERLSAHPLCDQLVECLRNQGHSATAAFTIPAQGINDYRLYLAGLKEMISDSHLCEILNFARAHPGYALYGAGAIGRRLLRMLNQLETPPGYIIDRNWEQCRELNGIPVIGPEAIDQHQIQAVIIASLSYREEIREFLNQDHPSIIVM